MRRYLGHTLTPPPANPDRSRTARGGVSSSTDCARSSAVSAVQGRRSVPSWTPPFDTHLEVFEVQRGGGGYARDVDDPTAPRGRAQEIQ